MNARPPDGSDEPEAVDQVMLAVLSNRGRDATALSAEQERLVDDWVAGRLAPDDAERAAALVRKNTLAAKPPLERRSVRCHRESAGSPSNSRRKYSRRARRRRRQRWAPGGARSAAGSGRASPVPQRWHRSWWSPACRCCSR